MSVFEDLRNGIAYDIRNDDYQREAHGEMRRCRHLCWKINQTDPDDREGIITLERELFCGNLPEGSFLTPPFQIDIACCFRLGRNVFANHGLTAMSIGTIIVDDGVMFGPEVGLFTVNHEPKNIRVIMTKSISRIDNRTTASSLVRHSAISQALGPKRHKIPPSRLLLRGDFSF